MLYFNRCSNTLAKKKLFSYTSYGATWKQLLPGKLSFVGRSLPESVCVCVSMHIYLCVVTLEHKENNCHWNVTRFHLTSVLWISQATSGCKWRNDCQAHALQFKLLCMRMPARLKISWESSVKVMKQERLIVCHCSAYFAKYSSICQIKKVAEHIPVYDVWR